MQRLLIISAALATVALITIAATLPVTRAARDWFVNNRTDTVGLTITKGADVTANFVEAYVGGTLTFAVPADGKIDIANGGTGAATAAAAKTAFGIQSGSVTTATDGTVTNTFSTAFASAPVVVISPVGEAVGVTNNLVSVTASNFVYSAGQDAQVAKWIAVGAP